MAGPVVAQVYRVSEQDRATEDQSGEQFIQFWRVEFSALNTDLPFGTPFDAKTATDGTTSIPAYGFQLAGTSLYVVNKTAQVNSLSPNICDVYVTYGAAVSVSLRIDDVPFTQNVITDWYGKRVVNSNRQPYPKDIPVEKADQVIVATITSMTSPGNYDAVLECINASAVNFAAQGLTKNCAAKTLRLAAANPSVTYNIGSWAQYTTVYQFKWRKDGWNFVTPDCGTVAVLRNSSGAPVLDAAGHWKTQTVLDAYGRPYNNGQVFYLDGNGNKLPDSATNCVLGPNSDGTWGTAGAADAAGVQIYELDSSAGTTINALLTSLGIGS
jgi:hypothetical protein